MSSFILGGKLKSTTEAMNELLTQLTGENKGMLSLVEACNLMLDYVLLNGFGGGNSSNPLTPAQIENIKTDVINRIKTQVPIGVMLKDCEIENDKLKYTLSDNTHKELDLTNMITKLVKSYVDTHKSELKGDRGIQGLQGQPGVKGDRGEDGQKGQDGISIQYTWRGTELGLKKSNESDYIYVDLKGAKGDNGTTGSKGERGLQGKSAYDLWLEQGNSGTVQTFLNSLKGEQGLQGARGIDGANGVKGDTGESAFDTWKRVKSKPSASEAEFIDSLKGEKGSTGLDGAKGEKGTDGVGIASLEKQGTKLVITLTNSQKHEFELPSGSGSGGTNGKDGVSLDFSWNGTQLGIKKSTDVNYVYTDLKGQKGDTGAPGQAGEKGQDGTDGVSLEFNWQGTRLGIKKANELSYTYVDLKGADGQKGERGTDGLRGAKGNDGIGIKEINLVGNTLNIRLDNDTIKSVELPLLKGDTGLKGEQGVGIAGIRKQDNDLVISLTDGHNKQFSLPQPQIEEQAIKAITDSLYKALIDNKLDKGTLSSNITAKDLKDSIDTHTEKLTKTITELKLEGTALKFKENELEKTINLPQSAEGLSEQQIKSIIDRDYKPSIDSKAEKTELNDKVSLAKYQIDIQELETKIADKQDKSTAITLQDVQNEVKKLEGKQGLSEEDASKIYVKKDELREAIGTYEITLPKEVVYTNRENNFTTAPQINGKEIATKEYVDNHSGSNGGGSSNPFKELFVIQGIETKNLTKVVDSGNNSVYQYKFPKPFSKVPIVFVTLRNKLNTNYLGYVGEVTETYVNLRVSYNHLDSRFDLMAFVQGD